MKTAIILHGICDAHEYYEMDFPSSSNAHWLPWLQQKFLRAGTLCQTLEMPTPYAPKYNEWAQTFEQLALKDDTIIVGHSAGCGFILKWLREHPDVKLEKLIMVAPFMDPSEKFGDFFKGGLPADLTVRVKDIHILYSLDEPIPDVLITKDKIIETYPGINTHVFTDKKHFCLSDTGPTFEDLWALCQ